jgi:hypothetical protein
MSNVDSQADVGAPATIADFDTGSVRPYPGCPRASCDGPRVRLPFSAVFVNCQCAAEALAAGESDRAKA